MAYRVAFAILTALLGAALVAYAHLSMANFILKGDLQQAIRSAEELYAVSMKSEVEAARLGMAISQQINGTANDADRSGLLDALDIMFSRLHLHDKSAVFQALKEQELYANTLRTVERTLEGLDTVLLAEDIDYRRALELHARLAVAMNEITRLSLDFGSASHDTLSKQAELFVQRKTSLMWVGVALLFVSFLPLVFMSGDIIRAKREGNYELV